MHWHSQIKHMVLQHSCNSDPIQLVMIPDYHNTSYSTCVNSIVCGSAARNVLNIMLSQGLYIFLYFLGQGSHFS